MSFVAVVLQNTEYWPAAGAVTAYEINNSLILPLAAQAVMGSGGVVAVIIMVGNHFIVQNSNLDV